MRRRLGVSFNDFRFVFVLSRSFDENIVLDRRGRRTNTAGIRLGSRRLEIDTTVLGRILGVHDIWTGQCYAIVPARPRGTEGNAE